MHKLSYLQGSDWVEHSYAPVFTETVTNGGAKRIFAGVPGSDPLPFEQLVLSLEPPYLLLYILHTPRGGGKQGRYQSPELTAEQLRDFMAKFGGYLSSDARFDIWAFSPSQKTTIVWDRHNQLYAYGSLDQLSAVLRALGFVNGTAEIPSPHAHNYHKEFDSKADELLAEFAWYWTPLRPEDEQ